MYHPVHRRGNADRRRTSVVRAGVTFVIAVLLVTLPEPTTRAGATTQATDTQSPWAGPWNPTVSPAAVDRFVDLWSRRVTDQRWMEPYLARDSVPDDVAAEGFHGIDTHSKLYLAQRLFDRLSSTESEVAESVARLRDQGQEGAIDDQKMLLYLLVFEKQWLKELRAKNGAGVEPTPLPSPESDLDRAIASLREVAPIALPSGSTAGVAGVPQLQTAATDLPGPLGILIEPLFQGLPIPTDVLLPGTYKACHEGAAARSCSAPVPLGTPVPLDLNGDALPEVVASLGPDASAPASSALAYKVVRMATATPDLAVHVYILTDVASAGRRLSVGFDGRSSRLSRESSMSVRLDQLLTALAGNVDVSLRVTNVDPGPTLAATFGVWNLTAGASAVQPGTADPVTGSLQFAPVPTSVTVDVAMHRAAGQDDHQVHLRADRRTRVTADLRTDSSTAGSRRALKATVADMPSDVNLRFTRQPSTGIMSAYFRADGVIDTATFEDVSTPSIAKPGTYRRTEGTVRRVPGDVSLVFDPSTPGAVRATYKASSVVSSVAAGVRDFVAGRSDPLQAVTATVDGVPSSVDLLLDMNRREVTGTASSPVGLVKVAARIPAGNRVWDGTLALTGIPREWKLGYDSGRPRFQGISGPIATVEATLSNHGAVTTPPGNHASVVYRSSTDDFDASFRMSSVELVQFEKTELGFTTDLRMGGGNRFAVNGDVVHNGTSKALATIVLDPLPKTIKLAQAGESLSYTASGNFNLSLYGEVGNVGALANTPSPPGLQSGVSVRDGSGCVGWTCGTGVKARLVLPGAPIAVSVALAGSGGPRVEVVNFNPPAASNFLVVDATLEAVTSPRTRISALQSGIPGGATFTVGPISTATLSDGSKRTSVAYSSSPAGLGPFTAEVERGTDWGRLELSNVPSSVTAVITAGKETSTVQASLGESVRRISGLFRNVGDTSPRAGFELLDVPTSITDLSFGRISKTVGSSAFTVPGLRYRADASTLGLNAFVDAALMGGDVRARVTASLKALGASTDAFLEDSGRLRVISVPGTEALELRTWGSIRSLNSLDGCKPNCSAAFRIQTSGHANIDPVIIDDLKLRVTQVRNLGVRLGLTSAVEGSYGSFEFGWRSVKATLDIEANLRACVGTWCSDLVSFAWHPGTVAVNVLFRLSDAHWYKWSDTATAVPCGPWFDPWSRVYRVVIDINPHRHFDSWNGFQVTAAAAESAWVVTPNLGGVIPSLAMDFVQAMSSPLGGGLAVRFPCV